jgi:hypothetical protein
MSDQTPAAPTPPTPPAAPASTPAAPTPVTPRPATVPPAPSPSPALVRASRGGGGAFASLLALCSLLISGSAGAVAVYALDQAREAKSQAAIAAANPRASSTPAKSPTTSSAPKPSPSASPSAIPTASLAGAFVADFVANQLVLPPVAGCASVYVDVDTMEIGIADGHDFYLSSCFGQPSLRIDRSGGAAPTATVVTPQACSLLLAGIQTAHELVLSIRTGLTFCLITNAEDAARLGQPQRLAIGEIRSISTEGAVTLVLSTYRVPKTG